MSDAVGNQKLAAILRESAAVVEQGVYDPILFQAIAELHAYANKHQGETAPPKQQQEQQVSKHSHVANFTLSGIGKKLGKLSLSQAEKERRQATSTKNAERVRADLADLRGDASVKEETTAFAQEPSTNPKPSKPSFQRPVNPNSSMIANGWISQQRRSKMRVVWKDVLASLVEGRKPNEETTLWIQREIVSSTTGKPALEALHQIPIKWLEEVQYLDFYGDNRFSIKVYNVAEDFLFRCANEEAAQSWVLTLRSVKETVMRDRHKKSPADDANDHRTSSFVSRDSRESSPIPPEAIPVPQAPQPAPTEPAPKKRMTVKELRAIAHGAGINTSGMERAELERVVAEITNATAAAKASAEQEGLHQREIEAARRREEQERLEEQRRREEKESQAREEAVLAEKRRAIEEEQRRRVLEQRLAEEKAAEERRLEQLRIAEEQRRAAEERRRAEEQQRILEEQQRRQAEEQRRLAEEHRRRVLEQQAVERKRQEEEQRRRYAEQQQAELRRRQEEAQRQYQQQQQQWQQYQQQQQQWQQYQQQQAAQQQAKQQQQWQQYQQQYAKQQQQHQQPPQQPFFNTNGGQSHPQQHQQRQQSRPDPPKHQPSMASMKYAKMADQSEDNQEKITAIKRNILVHWALQPPMLQMLRPISDLLCNVHTVFPPAFGVAAHDYFSKWVPLSRDDVLNGVVPDDAKLKKAHRKLRFFLHPDKLPKDLNEEQQFMCKMLWDVTNDAWEEFSKRNEELDWVQK